MKDAILSFDGDYRFLSNFTMVSISYEGVHYPSTEHAYQAAKSLKHTMRLEIASMSTPGQVKRFANSIILREDWDDVKIDVMLELTRLKFNGHAELREQLLATGSREIVEGNTWNDVFWGVCKGVGENHLGKILMHVRSELHNGERKDYETD